MWKVVEVEVEVEAEVVGAAVRVAVVVLVRVAGRRGWWHAQDSIAASYSPQNNADPAIVACDTPLNGTEFGRNGAADIVSKQSE